MEILKETNPTLYLELKEKQETANKDREDILLVFTIMFVMSIIFITSFFFFGEKF